MRQSEVHYQHLALLVNHDVLRFQVAMDDVGSMCRFEPAADLADNVDALRVGECLAAQSALKVLAIQKLHGDEFRLVRHSQVENSNDIAVCDLPGEDQFPLKTLQDVGVPGEFGANDF